MKKFAIFTPKATRDDARLKKRLESQREKRYDKYKIEMERLEIERRKTAMMIGKEMDSDKSDYSEMRGLYFADDKNVGDEDSESYSSGLTVSSYMAKPRFFDKWFNKYVSTKIMCFVSLFKKLATTVIFQSVFSPSNNSKFSFLMSPRY